MKQKFCILTLGCPKNIVDSEYIINSLPKEKFILTEKVEEANLILLNTCGFIADSISESYGYINSLVSLKKKFPEVKIIVFGCLVSRQGSDKLYKLFPSIDKFFPILDKSEILSYLNANYNFLRKDLLVSPYYSYLKISDGCNRKCAFCTIPQIKGKYTSRELPLLIQEAKYLSDNNVKELILIAQETTNYGCDLKDEKSNFLNLLEQLSDIEKLQWIRIMYSHPLSFDLRILELMNLRTNICKYIDIPLQHISDNMLKQMKRKLTSTQIKQLIKNMREIVPNIAIRSTFIVGFPGETEQDFEELYNFLDEYKLDRVGVFKYSAEENTIGATLENQIPNEVKDERLDKLMTLQKSISLKRNQQMINKAINVFVENEIDDYFIARTEADAPEIDNSVIIDKKRNNKIKIGDFTKVKIRKATEYDLFV